MANYSTDYLQSAFILSSFLSTCFFEKEEHDEGEYVSCSDLEDEVKESVVDCDEPKDE